MTESKTPAIGAVARYQGQFKRFSANGGGKAPMWLTDLRERAIGRFAETGFPTTHHEEWRFTNVQPIAETPFDLAEPREGLSLAELEEMLPKGSGQPRLVLVDGRSTPSLSRLKGIPRGVRVESFADAFASSPDLLRRHLGKYAGFESGGFSALSAAFIGDGALVHVAADVEWDEPLQIVFASSGASNRVSHPRCLVLLERGSRAVVHELYLARSSGKYFTNAVTELVVGDGARLDHCRFQREGLAAYHVATTQSHQGRDSVLESCSVAFGARLCRHDIGAVLNGSGAFLTLNGLSVLGGKQHVDHHTVIDHAQPHCESHELFNGVFDGQARGVFNGRIIVRPGAQRTDSKQTNNNLLLSSEARADSQPQLEIYADDVKCTHGATLGPLDDASMFYLQSRGIDATDARRLLTYGFGADVVGRVRSARIREELDRALAEQLEQVAIA